MIQKHNIIDAEEGYKGLRREEKRTHKGEKLVYLNEIYAEIENLKTQTEARKIPPSSK